VARPELIGRSGNNDPEQYSRSFAFGGAGGAVSDAETRRAQLGLAQEEGLFVEASSAASLAGLRKMVAAKTVSVDESGDESVVLMLTGAGIKSPEVVAPLLPRPRHIPAHEGQAGD
ncbi:MAG: pyridoxal-phosphate dependent enzyme, partial [Alphaproteobacteria bacterium]|nr:pyridoxal-phosphate dependent enzyme [Alphaproteobacteria bacterium]